MAWGWTFPAARTRPKRDETSVARAAAGRQGQELVQGCLEQLRKAGPETVLKPSQRRSMRLMAMRSSAPAPGV
jgi:hypothetical protein